MKPKNVLLATKQTALEYFRMSYDNLSEMLPEEDIAKLTASHQMHYKSFERVKNALSSAGIPFQRVYMPYAAYDEFQGRDLVISVGGDGTVLNTSHYVLDSTPVLTIKSDTRSQGALCIVQPSEIEEAIEKLIEGRFSQESWSRIEGKLGNRTDIALNEILIGNKYTPKAAVYEISLNGKTEKQMSSGLIITTGAGSTGFYSNIAGNDGKFPKTSGELRFIATAYKADANYRMVKGKITPGESIEIRSFMNIEGIVSFDGDTQKRMNDFPRGSRVVVRVSDKPLNVIVVEK